MELIFRGGNQLVRLILDRNTKTAKISSSKTNYDFIPLEWKQLFDKGKERIQEKITDKLSDEDFKKTIILSMAKNGYENVLIKHRK